MRNRKWIQKIVCSSIAALGLSLCFSSCSGKNKEDQKEPDDKQQSLEQQEHGEEEEDDKEKTIVVADLSDKIKKDKYRNQAAIHDPCLFKDGNLYYAFGSHMAAATSSDLWNWDIIANSVTNKNKLFHGLLGSDAYAWCGKNESNKYSFWGPDVIYNSKMRKYCMYFAVRGKDGKSSICLATADSVSGPFTFSDRVLDSGFSRNDYSNSLAAKKFGKKKFLKRGYFNSEGEFDDNLYPAALDPSVFYDADGRLWMVYGSWNGGIYLLELDKKTGLPVSTEDNKTDGTDAYYGKHILGYGNESCEAPYIMYQEEQGYYYLFVSYGNISSDGGYDIREFRSEHVTGPYVDAMGQSWTEEIEEHDTTGVKLVGNYCLPGNAEGYVSSGHPAVITDSDGRYLLVHHIRFDDGKEDFEIRIRQLFLNEDGWLVADPFNMNNLKGKEELKESGYGSRKLLGTYYLIEPGTEITADIKQARAMELAEDGELFGAGSDNYWEKIDGMPYGNITLEQQTYQGVFIKQKDEGGHNVMVFSGICNENNQALWAVKYLELGEQGDAVPES